MKVWSFAAGPTSGTLTTRRRQSGRLVGLEVPPWAAEMFHVLTGDGWPAVDEDEINDLAQLWLAAGRELMQIA
ncbi:MAG TPA: hypothetical protein VFP72_04585, partial [Kineosporiaceae bacterium]|nr:hypothetical protein [Kineosporiaceae bacterium]